MSLSRADRSNYNKMSSLFRQEALDHHSRAWRGEVLLIRPVPLTIMVNLCAILLCGILALIFFWEIPETILLQGEIKTQKGQILLYAPEIGIINETYVKPGDYIKAGDRIFKIANAKISENNKNVQKYIIEQIKKRIASFENERSRKIFQFSENKISLASRKKLTEAQLKAIESENGIGEEKLQAAKLDYNQYEEYTTKGYLSPAGLRAKRNTVLDIEAQTKVLLRSKISIFRELEEIGDQIKKLHAAFDGDMLTIDRNLMTENQLLKEREFIQTQIVSSPVDGIVDAINVRSGQFANTSQVLGAVTPNAAPLQLELRVSERAISYIKVGEKIAMRYHAFPYRKYGTRPATIRTVSQTPLQSSAIEINKVASLYLVTAELDENSIKYDEKIFSLKAGMAADVEINIDRQTLVKFALGLH